MSQPRTSPEGQQAGPAVPLETRAVVFEQPEQLSIRQLPLSSPGPEDLLVDIHFSGISTGTERLLWSGKMPHFPGLGYPLVPGYESVGQIVEAGPDSDYQAGEWVFVPGARCFGDEVRGLFGGTASRLVVAGSRVVPLPSCADERGILMALAATAWHAVALAPPELVIGHGVLGRLVARIGVLLGTPPTVWEVNPLRCAGALGYSVVDPSDDERRDYTTICDVSGDASLLDTLIGRLAPRGEVVLAGFYSDRLSFSFPQAFMREARLRVAAEWKRDDIDAVAAQIASGALSLDGLITHHHPADDASTAYRTAFEDPECLKMVLNWRGGA